jgi:hypothetical protein
METECFKEKIAKKARDCKKLCFIHISAQGNLRLAAFATWFSCTENCGPECIAIRVETK